jgi:fructokinase
MQANNTYKVACFGEMLWDMPPGEQHPGGAPMNVALNLRKMGVESKIISRVGKDSLGEMLLAFVDSFGLDTQLIGIDSNYPTSTVQVDLTDPTNAKYDIIQHVAWDNITYEDAMLQAVKRSEIFVYGSLVARDTTSRSTLFKLMDRALFNVFDANLRDPYYSISTVERLMMGANAAKLNDAELDEICSWYNQKGSLREKMLFLESKFALNTICVTLGSHGAIVYTGQEFVEHPGFKVNVASTTGSGDAFLAGWIKKYLDGSSPFERLEYACAIGALVATHKSANPDIKPEEVQEFLQLNTITK